MLLQNIYFVHHTQRIVTGKAIGADNYAAIIFYEQIHRWQHIFYIPIGIGTKAKMQLVILIFCKKHIFIINKIIMHCNNILALSKKGQPALQTGFSCRFKTANINSQAFIQIYKIARFELVKLVFCLCFLVVYGNYLAFCRVHEDKQKNFLQQIA